MAKKKTHDDEEFTLPTDEEWEKFRSDQFEEEKSKQANVWPPFPLQADCDTDGCKDPDVIYFASMAVNQLIDVAYHQETIDHGAKLWTSDLYRGQYNEALRVARNIFSFWMNWGYMIDRVPTVVNTNRLTRHDFFQLRDFLDGTYQRVNAELKARERNVDEEDRNASALRNRLNDYDKIALISQHLQAKPAASSREVADATGIWDSEVRRLWKPMKKSLKETKRHKPAGGEGGGEAIDESKECSICETPISTSWECSLCNEVIVGECKACHFTNSHPNDAIP